MTRDEILQMAMEAGFERNALCEALVRHSNGSWVGVVDELIGFAALVVAAEREACAKVCETFAWMHPNASLLGPEQNRMDCATAIRARGGTIPQTTHSNTIS